MSTCSMCAVVVTKMPRNKYVVSEGVIFCKSCYNAYYSVKRLKFSSNKIKTELSNDTLKREEKAERKAETKLDEIVGLFLKVDEENAKSNTKSYRSNFGKVFANDDQNDDSSDYHKMFISNVKKDLNDSLALSQINKDYDSPKSSINFSDSV